MISLLGLKYVGEVFSPLVNEGAAIPLFEMDTPKNKRDINTVDGWNAMVEEHERKRKKEII